MTNAATTAGLATFFAVPLAPAPTAWPRVRAPGAL